MKPLNEVLHLNKQVDAESRQAVLDTLILAQIQGLEKIMENNGAYVKSALAYNHCVGLIGQLKYYASAAYREPELSLPMYGPPDPGVPTYPWDGEGDDE
jgi:hypothetical protein